MISRKIPNNGVYLIRRSSSETVKRTRFASSTAAWARRAHRLSNYSTVGFFTCKKTVMPRLQVVGRVTKSGENTVKPTVQPDLNSLAKTVGSSCMAFLAGVFTNKTVIIRIRYNKKM